MTYLEGRMKKLLILFCTFSMVALWAGAAMALSDNYSHNVYITVQEVALVQVTPASASFTIGASGGLPGEPFYISPNNGSATNIGYDNSSYLWYTSIVAGSGYTRDITVHIDNAANIPAGYKLYVKAAADTVSSGCGNLGTAVTSRIDLGAHVGLGAAEVIVNDLGSGYTGRGANDGVNLIYELEMIPCNAGSLFAANYTTLVTYTLTDSVAP